MASMFGIFFVELFAFRLGSRLIIKTGLSYGSSFFFSSSSSSVDHITYA